MPTMCVPTAMFSVQASTSPTPATQSGNDDSGAGEGASVSSRRGKCPTSEAPATISAPLAMIGRTMFFILPPNGAHRVETASEEWDQTAEPEHSAAIGLTQRSYQRSNAGAEIDHPVHAKQLGLQLSVRLRWQSGPTNRIQSGNTRNCPSNTQPKAT
jgi:hypothetical protein